MGGIWVEGNLWIKGREVQDTGLFDDLILVVIYKERQWVWKQIPRERV